MTLLTIGTDGSAAPTNPGPCGCAWVADDGRWAAAHLGHGTNNIGELEAIRRAIAANPDRPLHVLSDSQYAINCITTWGPSWRKKGVTDKKNMDLVFAIIDLVEARRTTAPVTFQWVRAHDADNTAPLNSLADEYANRSADPGFGEQSGRIDDIAAASAAAAAKQPASRESSRAGSSASASEGRKPTGRFATMTDIGAAHGLSARQVGAALTAAGLRDGSIATSQAVEDGWAKQRHMRGGTQFSVWDRHRVAELLSRG